MDFLIEIQSIKLVTFTLAKINWNLHCSNGRHHFGQGHILGLGVKIIQPRKIYNILNTEVI
jgi:hypothetical protein